MTFNHIFESIKKLNKKKSNYKTENVHNSQLIQST